MNETSRRPRRETVDLFVPTARGPGAVDRAQRFLSDQVIAHPTLPNILYAAGQCWADAHPRTHARYLHGMLFLADWHNTVLAQENAAEVANTVAEVFLRWKSVVGDISDAPMAYHDETTAQRLMQLVRFLDDHGEGIDPAQRSGLAELASYTACLLLDEEFYAGANNHGMFQDLALLRYAAGGAWLPAEAPDVDGAVQVALGRLDTYFTYAFASDGVHVENSPGYHLMVSRFLRDVLPIMQELSPQRAVALEAIYRAAEKFAVHSILPSGELAPLGDTKVVRVRDTSHRSTFTGSEYQFAVSGGSQGRAPKKRSVVFPHGGYAFHRTSWHDPSAYVMTFKAAYLSGYHHHNDDLALTLFGHGRWLLTEAGPYGYDYAMQLTKYAFSQFAHNVVVIDRRSLPRVDNQPGGVALTDLAEEGGNYLMRMRGTNTRYPRARHTRGVVVREPSGHLEVSVADTVQPGDGMDHHYAILWHIGQGVETVLHGSGAELFVAGSKVLELSWSGPVPAIARMLTPKDSGSVQAVRFPEFGVHEPGSVIEVSTQGATLSLKTVIRAGNWTFTS